MKVKHTTSLLLTSILLKKAASYHCLPFISNVKYSHKSNQYCKNSLRQPLSTRLYSTTIQREHLVNGIKCVEITIPLPKIGNVTILEANAASQDDLVNSAIEPDMSESNYKLNADDPYGAVLWPASRTLAQYLLLNYGSQSSTSTEQKPLNDLTILELGAGTGLISIAAALAGADVIAADYEDIPLTLLQYASTHLNPSRKNERISIQTDIVVAADIMYEPRTGKAMATRAVEALKQNSRVIIADSPGRPGRNDFLKELEEQFGITQEFIDYQGLTCTGYRNELICGKDSTSISLDDEEEKGLAIAIMDLDPGTIKF